MSPGWSEKSPGKTPEARGSRGDKMSVWLFDQTSCTKINVIIRYVSLFSLRSARQTNSAQVTQLKFCTSICIFRWTLKWESKVRKIASESSKTSGTEETPFLDSATHRYCLMALTNISWVRNTGPAPCSTESSSCRETILDRNSWDLQRRGIVWASATLYGLSGIIKELGKDTKRHVQYTNMLSRNWCALMSHQ